MLNASQPQPEHPSGPESAAMAARQNAAMIAPTPYPDVNAVLHHFLEQGRPILGDHFVAMYGSGSLALGDFHPDSSDIDFVVVTDADLPDDLVAALRDMHAAFNAGDSPWATEVEAAYIPKDALRRYDPSWARHPHIQRGATEMLVWDDFASDWVLQRYVLREHGLVMTGPPPQTLIDPVPPQQLRLAVKDLVEVWWATMIVDQAPLRRTAIGYQAYAVLTMCRILYTLEQGAVVSKPVAARWAKRALDPRWTGLIDRALAWTRDRREMRQSDVDETVALIQCTEAQCMRLETHNPLASIAFD